MFKSISLILFFVYSFSANAYDFKLVADKHILPAYQKLDTVTSSLKKSVYIYCQNSDKDKNKNNIIALHSHFINAFNTWQSVQHIRLGPVQYLLREHRFELWPDKRGNVSKHLARLINDLDINQNQSFDISKKSVAVQGFSALEYLLFNNRPIDDKDCQLMKAISDNLNTMAQNTLSNWSSGDSPYRDDFISPGRDSNVYEDDLEVANELFNNLHTQLEFVITQKLGRPLGTSLEKARGKRAEGWRSQTSLSAVKANISAIEELYRIAFKAELKDRDLSRKIDHAFQQSQQALTQIALPLIQAVADESQRKQVVHLQQELFTLQQLIARDVSLALGLSIGFNSLDGD